MRSKINIKGRILWKLCALAVLGISLTCCLVEVTSVDQPTTATAKQVVPITLHDSISTQVDNGPISANYVFCLLAPKGWAAAQNTTVTYTSSLGNGSMQLMPSNIIEPANGKVNWVASATAKFGIGKNLVNDVEWVVFESVQPISIANGISITGEINIKITVGADGNNTSYFPEYVTCESVDGISDDAFWVNGHDYSKNDGPCLVQTGTDGDLHDYCNPQLASFNPPKALDNEFITLTYNNLLTPTPLTGNNNLYLCVDSAYLSDGTALTNFCMQAEKTQLVQTSASSGLFTLTFWPRSFFGLTSTQTLSKLVYYVTDQTGSKRVGYGGSITSPFTYKFECN
jgi:hypothetical protein